MGGRARDASWLIGPLLLVPALIYLNVWYFRNSDFLQHARRVRATITPYQWGRPKKERNPRYEGFSTYFEFQDEAGQKVLGYLVDSTADLDAGETIEVYYDTRHPDFRVASGPQDIYGGFYLALGTAALGVVLGFIAFLTSRRLPVETTPSYLDYWGGDNEYWSVKAKSELPPPERDVLD